MYLWSFTANFLATVDDLRLLLATSWSDLDSIDGREAKLWDEKNETKDELCEGTTKRRVRSSLVVYVEKTTRFSNNLADSGTTSRFTLPNMSDLDFTLFPRSNRPEPGLM